MAPRPPSFRDFSHLGPERPHDHPSRHGTTNMTMTRNILTINHYKYQNHDHDQDHRTHTPLPLLTRRGGRSGSRWSRRSLHSLEPRTQQPWVGQQGREGVSEGQEGVCAGRSGRRGGRSGRCVCGGLEDDQEPIVEGDDFCGTDESEVEGVEEEHHVLAGVVR